MIICDKSKCNTGCQNIEIKEFNQDAFDYIVSRSSKIINNALRKQNCSLQTVCRRWCPISCIFILLEITLMGSSRIS